MGVHIDHIIVLTSGSAKNIMDLFGRFNLTLEALPHFKDQVKRW